MNQRWCKHSTHSEETRSLESHGRFFRAHHNLFLVSLVFFLSAAEETEHVLKVLCSHGTAFIKKQEVINCVLGDCHLERAEDWKSTKKAGELVQSLWGVVLFGSLL